MDWDLAIKRNSAALVEIVADLFALLGRALTDTAARLPWPTYRAVLRVLRPAESALRRLIVVAARGIVVTPAPLRSRSAGPLKTRKGLQPRSSAFPLFDPRKRIVLPRRRAARRLAPRIHFFGPDPRVVALWPVPQPAAVPLPPTDGLVNAERLIRRLEALEFALSNLPRQARRLVRWRMRQERAPAPSFKSPLRPGHPPGHRKRKIHEVDELLSECHGLACYAMMPDTS
jgi:hypothetical protein